jgi:hypothetical protein
MMDNGSVVRVLYFYNPMDREIYEFSFSYDIYDIRNICGMINLTIYVNNDGSIMRVLYF